MSYILMTGAPGSKWSSVCKNIYWSEDIDHSDYTEERTYSVETDTPGEKKVGKYEWRTGEEGDAAVRTLKSFITPGALKTLSDFGKNQLGYNAIYKEELTK